MKSKVLHSIVFPLCVLSLAACSPQAVEPQPSAASANETAPAATALSTRATALVDHLAAGQFGEVFATFDSTMAAALPESGLATVWGQLQQTVGAYKAHSGLRETREAGYDVVYVACSFERSNLNAKVVFGKDGKVSGLFFQP